MADTLYIIDASGFIFRAYHALPSFSTSAGVPTGAVLGYTTMLLKLLADYKPVYLAAAFDAARDTFRTAEYSDYKANRPDLPLDLAPQFPLIFEVTKAFAIPLLLAQGFEADDLIATLAKKARAGGLEVVILSGDKDLMQLVGEGVWLHDPIKQKRYGPKDVEEKLGVTPAQVPDFLGLMGDASDNIPGVPGIGEKTAAELLKAYGSLEKVLESVEEIKGPKRKEALKAHAEDARLSKRLATLRDDAPVAGEPGDYKYPGFDPLVVKPVFAKLEFHKLAAQMAPTSKIERKYRTIFTREDFEAELAKIRERGEFAVDLETTSIDPHRAEIVGIALSSREGDASYTPISHRYLGAPQQLPLKEALPLLKPILEDPKLRLYGQHSKYERVIFRAYGVEMAPVAIDTMLASYVLDPTESHSLSAISQRELGHDMIVYEDVTGRGKKQIGFDEVDVVRATEYSGEDADVTFRLAKLLPPKVEAAGLMKLLVEVEQPLSSLLAKIEANGVVVDVEYLRRMSQKLGAELLVLEKRCQELAGVEFNVNSPKQLQEILFERLKLPVVKRTKTGPSTDSSVLEEIEHPLAEAILEQRQLAKLKGTYLDTFPSLVNPRTGRIHTSFNQAVAATGRLSSSEPGLQNIPVRTEIGRDIRRAFIAPPGHTIVSTDYSQIELRLMAHFSGDGAFMEAFQKGEDIHRRTAAEIFSKKLEEVTPDERRASKTIVFGLIYGMGAFRLKRQLGGIHQAEAQAYIDRFFARYSGVKGYFDGVLASARASGEIRTILGRRRAIPDLNSPNRQVRSNAERMATNSPLQGSAADIMKLAMLRVDEAMQREGLKSKMTLQVHDELLFEAPEAEVQAIGALAKREMEAVGVSLGLRVPLIVEVGAGANWADAH
jgi:DNA polymerase I